jgi:hypothetical protein
MKLIGSIFRGGGKDGDFSWMIDQPDYSDALFIFNDNEQQFYAHKRHGVGSAMCVPGGGNAAVRPYQCKLPQRAAGVPTGSNGVGYAGLDHHVRGVIDDALTSIADLLASGQFDRIIYSAANSEGDLGTGIFEVDPQVRAYIVDGLRRTAALADK